jgi:hypothetical protein
MFSSLFSTRMLPRRTIRTCRCRLIPARLHCPKTFRCVGPGKATLGNSQHPAGEPKNNCAATPVPGARIPTKLWDFSRPFGF